MLGVGWCGSVLTAADHRIDFFEQKIRPVLVEHCYECHSQLGTRRKGGLLLDSAAGVLKGGDSGPVLRPGKAHESPLIRAIRYGDRELQMPPKGRLPESVIADLVRWIDDGAFDPREGQMGVAKVIASRTNTEHWAFQPIQAKGIPAGKSAHPIDRFIEERLARIGLSIGAEAERRTLIRRVSFDLTGLPPEMSAIHAFLQDTEPGAYERLLDRYLASPQYGERWGRWWLDVARYADTNGQDENKVMANAWRYRDWVIRSFNRNQPFDSFIIDQLAGDLVSTNGVDEKSIFDRWTATGFLVLGPKMLAEQDKPKLLMDLVDEQIEVTTRAFLGLTVGCARCHDHKFDPVSARDYYALAGIFRSTKTMDNLNFVSKFNERQITDRLALDAREFYFRQVEAVKSSLAFALRQANQSLLDRWRALLPQVVDRSLAGHSVEDLSLPNPVALERLKSVLLSESSSNQIGRTLRRLANDPGALAAAFSEAEVTGQNQNERVAVGKVGAGFRATGTTFIERDSSPVLEPNQLTVETWFQTPSFSTQGDARRWLVSKNSNEESEGHYALVLDGARAGAYLNVGGGPKNIFTVWSSEGLLKPGQWHHLALTYDGSTFRLFVDGKPAGKTVVGRTRVPGKGPLVLGRRGDGYGGFKGVLDDVWIFSRALNKAEIETRFRNLGSGSLEGSVAHWDFNSLTESEARFYALIELRDFLIGSGGVFALPSDPRPYYPASVRDRIRALEDEKERMTANAPPPLAMVLAVEEGKPVSLPIHVRGSHLNLARDPVPRGFIRGVGQTRAGAISENRSGRLELASWLIDETNPLTARVLVNRIWQGHFGEGLVRSSDNFGVRGEVPSHPELLDWLAQEFIRSGWDVKYLHRLILKSAAWRQTGLVVPLGATAVALDPDNRLLGRFPRQRLEAEMIRDALISVSGQLDLAIEGSLVNWKNDEYTPEDTVSAETLRRSVYLPVVRDRVYDVFTLFDFANPSVGTSRRTPTVVSHQALFFLNSPLVKSAADKLARLVIVSSPSDRTDRIKLAVERVWGRLPTLTEQRMAESFLKTLEPLGSDEISLQSWAAWCQVLLLRMNLFTESSRAYGETIWPRAFRL